MNKSDIKKFASLVLDDFDIDDIGFDKYSDDLSEQDENVLLGKVQRRIKKHFFKSSSKVKAPATRVDTYYKTQQYLDFIKTRPDGVTTNDLKLHFGLTPRTAERLFQNIKKQYGDGIFSISGTKQKIYKLNAVKLKAMDNDLFTLNDVALFNQAKKFFEEKGLKHQASRMEGYANRFEKLSTTDDNVSNINNRLFIDAMEGVAYFPIRSMNIDNSTVVKIRNAILHCNQIRFDYEAKHTGKKHKYTIEPYGILYGTLDHYLIGKHADGYFGNELHQFSLNNITNIETLNEIANIPEDFSIAEYTKDSFGVFKEKPFDVEWKFSKKSAYLAKNMMFHPSQNLTENKDGSLTVKFKAGGLLEMAWHLYIWGNEVEVIKPNNFWERVEDIQNNMF